MSETDWMAYIVTAAEILVFRLSLQATCCCGLRIGWTTRTQRYRIYELVKQAQNGDKQALYEIIDSFSPLIKQMKRKSKRQEQDDLEQSMIETIIRKILTYNINLTPSFTGFCDLQEKGEN